MTRSGTSQFERPNGLVGGIAGHVMPWLNADMTTTVVGMLELRGSERVLEIGFGPGTGIAALLARLPAGRVHGVDPSPVMLRQAARRNRRALRDGRADLRLGSATSLPWPAGHFAAVCSVNALQFWDLDRDLAEVRRVLTPDGQLALGVHAWAGKGGAMPDRDLAHDVPAALGRAGFTAVTAAGARARSGAALYFAAVPAARAVGAAGR